MNHKTKQIIEMLEAMTQRYYGDSLFSDENGLIAGLLKRIELEIDKILEDE